MAKETPETPKAWEAKKIEDHLLAAYRGAVHPSGTMFANVQLAGKGRRSKWPDSASRRIDGVMVMPPLEAAIYVRQAFTACLRQGWMPESVELIEAAPKLDADAIGRAMTSLLLWRHQYGVAVERTVLVVGVSDPGMEWVCEQLGFTVWVASELASEVASTEKKDEVRRRRPRESATLARLESYRLREPGTYVAGVSLGGPDAGVFRWEQCTELSSSYLRLTHRDADVMVLYDTPKRFLELVGEEDHPLELVEVRKELKRGAIGTVLVHTLMTIEQWGLSIGRKVIVCETADPALRWVCRQLGIDVDLA